MLSIHFLIYKQRKDKLLLSNQRSYTYLIWGSSSIISCLFARQLQKQNLMFTSFYFLILCLYGILKSIDLPVNDSIKYGKKYFTGNNNEENSIRINDDMIYKILAFFSLYPFALILIFL